jgi:signal peptidase II
VRSRWLFWGLFIGFVAIDQIVKHLARTNLDQREYFALWPNVFELTLTYNPGIAWGMFQGAGVLLSPVAVVIAIGAAIYSTRNPKESVWIHTAMGLLASGAVGNLIDRVWLGKVTDMFAIRAFDFPVFNIADVCISVAAGILVLRWGAESFKKPEPEPKEEPSPVIETPTNL